MGACEARTKVESRRWKVEDRPSEIDHRTSTIGDRRIAGSGSLCAPSLCEEGLTLPQERKFRVVADWEPAGDQPKAIEELSNRSEERRVGKECRFGLFPMVEQERTC